MSFFLDTQETTERFGNFVAEFRSLLDTDHIRHGSTDDLFEFAKTLESSNQFRLDLSSRVKSIVNSEPQEILLTDMMSIIVASVGGDSVGETRTDLSGPTRVMMEFLLGTGCWKRFGSSSHSVSRIPEEKPVKPAVAAEDSIPIQSFRSVSTVARSAEDRASLHDISNELRQTLSRLEASTRQVQHHLDSIERRIGQIEPVPETPSMRTAARLEPLVHRGSGNDLSRNLVQPAAAQPAVERFQVESVPAVEAVEPELPTRGRAVFSYPPRPDESQADDDFSSPTFAYGTEKARSGVPLWIFLALAVIGAAIFLFLHFGNGADVLKTGISNLKSDYPKSAAPASSSTPAAPSTTTAPPSSAATTSSAPPGAVPNAGSPSAAPPSSSTTPPRPDTAKNTSGTAPAHSTDSEEATSDNPDTQSTVEGPAARYIQSKVMEGYLISAPRPEYPAQARRDHIEGQVALQATISRSGSIQTLHAIKGPPSLRAAAIEAARHWRYRPYTVDGQPVKVATTIYVNFSLRPPPAIVH